MISMMNRHFDLTRWILVLTASIIPFMAMAQQTDDDENNTEEELVPQPKGKPNYVLTMGIIPEGYPLAIKEKNASAIGTLQEYGRKPVLFTLKNISDKTIKITHVESTCPCLELAAPIQDKTLAPQAELPVHFTVNATHLGYGPFDRVLMVAVEGFPVVKMGVLGEVLQSIDYDPSVCIDLGAFYGDVPFKRTYRLKSRFEHDDLKLLKPQDNPLFNITVKKTAPKTFEIEVTPKKLPLPVQRLREKFVIPVEGGALNGMDALLATVQMPGGIPVATVGVGSGGATNAALLAVQILALNDAALAERFAADRAARRQKVLDADEAMMKEYGN